VGVAEEGWVDEELLKNGFGDQLAIPAIIKLQVGISNTTTTTVKTTTPATKQQQKEHNNRHHRKVKTANLTSVLIIQTAFFN
jgi:hypothetical protein